MKAHAPLGVSEDQCRIARRDRCALHIAQCTIARRDSCTLHKLYDCTLHDCEEGWLQKIIGEPAFSTPFAAGATQLE